MPAISLGYNWTIKQILFKHWSEKKRHLWIWGPPDIGKTTSVYNSIPPKYLYRWNKG